MLPGHDVQARDVEQAYLQDELGGPLVYFMLPRELWTHKMHSMKCLVVRLEKALYGHKHSGVYWQEYCHKQCEAAGFFNVSTNWPGVYFNDVTKMLLVIYVDGMKLSGPKDKMKETWQALSQNLNLEERKEDVSGTHTFLRCIHKRSSRIVNGVKMENHGILCQSIGQEGCG